MIDRPNPKPIVEWMAALIGLIITLGMLGFVGWQALSSSETAPPSLSVVAGSVTPAGEGYVVDVTISNASSATAAAVQVRGDLVNAGAIIESSEMTFDYVPGRSQKKGGLIFHHNPALMEIRLRTVGYTEP